MRINIESDEHIVASLPKVWQNEVGFMGFFSKSREGLLILTNKKIVFVPQFFFATSKERERYYGEDKVKITQIKGYSETQLDEDITKNEKSLLIPLRSVASVASVTMRKVNFLRIKFTIDSKTKTYDFGITKSVTNYPLRQPLLFYNVDWTEWINLIKSFL